jgi:ATP-binding cassette subfamily G (WHITE) protein 2 (PDR)
MRSDYSSSRRSNHPATALPQTSPADLIHISYRPFTFPLTIFQQINVCMHRAYQRMVQNSGAAISSVVANAILGIIIASVFYNLDETAESLPSRALLLFFALMVNAFIPGVEVVTMWAQRPIVEKQFRYAFYHPFTERLASLIVDLPLKVILCFGIHTPIYFMANLRRSAGAFFIYWLFMFTNLITMSMLFRMIGAVSRTHTQTTTPVSIIVLLCIIYTGFVVPPNYMKPWLAWFRRINPLAYTYESLVVNEMHDRTFPCSTMIPSGWDYANVSSDQKICATIGSNLGDPGVQGNNYMAIRYSYNVNNLWRNLGILIVMMLIFGTVHLLASEFIAAQPSKGEVLFFRNSKKDTEKSCSDECVPLSSAALHVNKVNTSTTRMETADPKAAKSVFHWSGLGYEIKKGKETRQILRDINGWVQPGTLTALMGCTGAGKTTLLDILANRVSIGTVSGIVGVGNRGRNAGFQRQVGYVQQEDIHLATTTVREALQFSALLRQENTVPTKDKLAYVEQILEQLEMLPYADAVIGVPGEGLNVEQRKRLTIAVEMVGKPELLLFLDEPTSGLDSQTAWSICMLLRKLADNGQTILCTIHQPSSQIFAMFDRLLLLDRTGMTLYFGDLGPAGATMVNYFEKKGARRRKPHENPAEWVLEVTGNLISPSEDQASALSWPEIWNLSTENENVLRYLANLNTKKNQVPLLEENKPTEFAASVSRQMLLVSKRIFQDQWRDPSYLLSKIALSACLALINGISFYDSPLDIQGVINLLFSIFLITQLFSCVDQLVIPHFIYGRSIFEAREQNSRSYSWPVFVAANVLIELIWQTVIAIPIFVSWYYPTNLQQNGDNQFSKTERGALTFILIWLFNLWASTTSQVFATLFDHPDVAMNIATLLYCLALVFCGILVAPDRLPRFWIFMYRVSPLTYFLEGLATANFANAKISCAPSEVLILPLPLELGIPNCGAYLESFAKHADGQILNPEDNSNCTYCPYSEVNLILENFGMSINPWRDVGIFSVYVFFNLLAIFAVYWLVRVPKRWSDGRGPGCHTRDG